MAGLKPILADVPTEDLIRELQKRGLHVLPFTDVALLTEDGYMAEFTRFTTIAATYKQAWMMTEAKLSAIFRTSRYNNYGSMRSAASRYRRKKKLQKK